MGQLAAQLFHGQVCVIPSLSNLQRADKRSRVHFKCAICIWNLLLSTLKIRSKELSLSVKQAIIRLKNQNKPNREIAKTFKSTVWNILKKKECTGELSNTKRPGRPWKTNVVDDRKIISLVKKTPFTTVGQIKNTLREVGVCASKSTIKRRLHQSEYRGFTTRCKPLVSLKNRKIRLEFAKQHLKKPSQFWNNILWRDETKINFIQSAVQFMPLIHPFTHTFTHQRRLAIGKPATLQQPDDSSYLLSHIAPSTCTRMMGREEYGEGKELLMIQNIPPHQ